LKGCHTNFIVEEHLCTQKTGVLFSMIIIIFIFLNSYINHLFPLKTFYPIEE